MYVFNGNQRERSDNAICDSAVRMFCQSMGEPANGHGLAAFLEAARVHNYPTPPYSVEVVRAIRVAAARIVARLFA